MIVPSPILLNIGYEALNADWNWKNVCSPYARIYLVTSGMAYTRIGTCIHKLTPGHLYIIPPFTRHDDICEGPFSLYYIHFYENTSSESIFDIFDIPLQLPATYIYTALIQRLQEINPYRHLRNIDPDVYDNPKTLSAYLSVHETISYYRKIETQGILNLIIARFIENARKRTTTYYDNRIEKCIRHIHANLDKKLHITSLAEMSCMTHDHFTRLFRHVNGITPLQYINNKRIERAQILLLTTRKKVCEIAFDVGIENTAYFNRLFKNITSLTPKHYREQYDLGSFRST